MTKSFTNTETLWRNNSFILDDSRGEVASIKKLLGGFDEPCDDFLITRESFDNIVEGLNTNNKGEVLDVDLNEYLSYYLEHTPQHIRI